MFRADYSPIRIGSYTSVGEHSNLISGNAAPKGVPNSINIGNHVTIEPSCTVNSCIIDDGAYIGSRTVIGEGCKIEKGAVISPNSLVPHGRLIPSNQLWGGSPALYIRDLTEEEILFNHENSLKKWEESKIHEESCMKVQKQEEEGNETNEKLNEYLSENYIKWRKDYYH